MAEQAQMEKTCDALSVARLIHQQKICLSLLELISAYHDSHDDPAGAFCLFTEGSRYCAFEEDILAHLDDCEVCHGDQKTAGQIREWVEQNADNKTPDDDASLR